MTKLTQERQDKFIQLLRLGTPIKYACRACSIDDSLYYVWMKLGERDKDRPESKYFKFFEAVKRTEGEAMTLKLADLEKAAQRGSVQAITWFLEKKYPDEFGNKLQVTHDVKLSVQQVNDYFGNKNKEKKDEAKPTETVHQKTP